MFLLKLISQWALPVVFLGIPLYGIIKHVRVYDTFVEGAKEGFDTILNIIPPLVAMFVAIGMFRASGAMDMLVKYLSPLTSRIGLPAEVLPLALLKPLSGGASTGLVMDLLKTHGPDSLIGRMSSILYGSTETTIYVITVYFGSIGIKNVRHALLAGILTDLCNVIFVVMITRLLFG